ncbi:MAG: hypothetical protein LQ350_000787 [Teloschistes chrysophthalmus]|nr:MAG: hypothetical protein LQ350_000787 [Niorma chrysophthalma]
MPKRGTDTHPDPEPPGPRIPGLPSTPTASTTFRVPDGGDSDTDTEPPSPRGNVPGLSPTRRTHSPRRRPGGKPFTPLRPVASPFGASPFVGSGPSNQASFQPVFGGAPSLPFGSSPFLGSGPSNQASFLPASGEAPSHPHFSFAAPTTLRALRPLDTIRALRALRPLWAQQPVTIPDWLCWCATSTTVGPIGPSAPLNASRALNPSWPLDSSSSDRPHSPSLCAFQALRSTEAACGLDTLCASHWPGSFVWGNKCVNKVLFWAYENPQRWATVLACYFQAGEKSPREVACQFWPWDCGFTSEYRRNWRLLDIYNATGASVTPYSLGPEEVIGHGLLQLKDGDLQVLEDAMTRWSRDLENRGVCDWVLRETFWTTEWPYNQDWKDIHGILSMPEGKEKEEMKARAKKESPLFFAACLKDNECGRTKEIVKRTRPEEDHLEDHYDVQQPESGPLRTYLGARESPKRHKLNNWYELAKMGMVETGPFGKRRKGSTRISLRTTRTATPAKKESSAVDGFMRALQEDKRRAELYGEGIDPSASYAAQKDTITATANKEPVYVSLYGFSSDTQWAAISHYEKVSRGMICETYDRNPPMEARRYPTTFNALSDRRPLTQLEKKMSMGYKGGQAWIRVTFDSAEAAERACYFSPHLVQGHWVYAEPYVDGVIPNHDEPIPLRPEEREGDTTSAKPSHIPTHKTTQSLGPTFARSMHTQQGQANATLPTSFMPNTTSQQESPQPLQPESSSPSTASSATATAPSTATGGTNLRQRVFGQWSGQQPASDQQSGTPRLRTGNTSPFMTHFPDLPRIPLRPAHEALLPQPTLMERTLAWLEQRNLFPGDFIGNGPPRLENGDFDYANASFYWRFFHWVDSTFGTDICGLRDE